MRLGKLILDLLFPPKCVFCRRLLTDGREGYCDVCKEKYLVPIEPVSGTAFRKCAAALHYEGKVRDALIRFKFGGREEYAETFGRILAEVIERELTGEYDLITWIPVSRKRLRQRGYDQAKLLAKAAALELGESAIETLQKTVHNAAQSGMQNASERKKNVKDVYVADPDVVYGRRILLIDDIITTGATMDAAASALLSAGADGVVGAAVAHPGKNEHETMRSDYD